MKIDKSNFSLALMVYDNGEYDGTLNVTYNEKVLNKDRLLKDTIYIQDPRTIDNGKPTQEDPYTFTDSELKNISHINNLIQKSLDKTGHRLKRWILKYSYLTMSTLEIEYLIDNSHQTHYINLNLIEDNPICKKTLSLSRSVVKRILSKLS